MRRFYLAIGVVFLAVDLSAQTDTTVTSKPAIQIENKTIFTQTPSFNPFPDGYDRIIKLNKDTLVVVIQKITQSEIVFNYPFNTVQNRLPVFHIKEVIGKDGVPNTTFKGTPNTLKPNAADTIPASDWKVIVITENQNDVNGMEELGNVESRAVGDRVTTNTELVERNALLHLKKKAALLGATKILITDKAAQSPYGENPIVELTGVAYK